MDINELTYLLNGCALKVHQKLGCGFQETIYQRALQIEFDNIDINFLREEDQPIFYNGTEIGTRRADFIVNESVVIELKAVSELLPVHIVQTKNYVTMYNMTVGLLINFGAKSLQIKKIFPNNKIYNKQVNRISE